MEFLLFSSIQFTLSFFPFILKNPDYYNVPEGELGSVIGATGSYAELSVIIFDLFIGVIFDTVGRVLPVLVGLIVIGFSFIAMPFFEKVYPSFLILRIMVSLGILPGMNCPLLPDYVAKQSLGLANAYVRSKL